MDTKPNITCAVCGENDFHLKEGFYYCNECGTIADQVRAVEVERDDDFDGNVKHRNVLKIKTDKPETPELTSWECYNYILRGLVEELIEMGAKDELKPMVFQIWAAFLRNREVAFFSRRHADLPRLGIRFEERDATILYNHAQKRKKIRREKKENASVASGSRREWKKQMKKFDQSQYEASINLSQSICSQSIMSYSQSSLGESSVNSSGSMPTNRAIQLKFSSKARKQLKKKMPIAHLKKHEQDFSGALKCHRMSAQENELKHSDRTKELNMKLVYAILAVGLNLIEDDIQLVDLLRFISEGHISTNNLERFFPSNISEACKDTLLTYRLHYKSKEFTTTYLRAHCSEVGKAIHMKYLKTPNLLKLVHRYTTELCLPEDINTFIERLINLHPPKMSWDQRHSTPCYESRAMAYIIFTLKLLFGIDGRKEKQISRSARRVNAELAEMNLQNYDELFVWDDWAEYIELRKVLLSSKNLALCKQFKQKPTREMYLQNLEERMNHVTNKLSKEMGKRQANMSAVFQHFLNVGGEREEKEADKLNFTPSLTPCHSYLNRLKLDPKINDTIPKCLNVDHSKRSLLPLLHPSKLKETFFKCDKKLKIVRLSCTSKQHFVGTFRNSFSKCTSQNPKNPRKVNLTNDTKPWETMLEADKPPDSIFQTDMEYYCRRSLAIRKNTHNMQNIEEDDPSYILKYELSEINDPNFSMSFGLLDKDDMNTIDARLTAPRRNLERINLFADLSEDESDSEEMDQSQEESFANVSVTSATTTATTKLKISSLDFWLLMGKTSELIETQANELKHNFQLSFFWLLETCALTIGVDWKELYDELLVLETFFAYAIEPLENFKDRIIFKEESKIKDINKLVRHFQSYW